MPTKAPIKLSTIGYVILYVPNTEDALKFYQDTLGIPVRMSEEGWTELETGTTTLALHANKDGKPTKASGELPVIVFNVECIDSAYDHLKGKGVKFEKEPQIVCETPDHVGRSADFQDPYGNRLSIFSMGPRK